MNLLAPKYFLLHSQLVRLCSFVGLTPQRWRSKDLFFLPPYPTARIWTHVVRIELIWDVSKEALPIESAEELTHFLVVCQQNFTLEQWMRMVLAKLINPISQKPKVVPFILESDWRVFDEKLLDGRIHFSSWTTNRGSYSKFHTNPTELKNGKKSLRKMKHLAHWQKWWNWASCGEFQSPPIICVLFPVVINFCSAEERQTSSWV